ncbi:MAG: aminotransferase class V-fold PLP-dependent enzyme [Bacteroidetes bacterium]|nr:aminotransferase class V-fold PLP-dependent enzyme [Bacteroidota bacterium]MBP7398596.1 aminotransferase class V-fold PLP-dependent enzyme [Chitinophagales bacterium]MBK8487384.1 aminotransferase class V-fold PLP-dependent enzyme [Bacteroidota bacterium]MBK8682874.1 aminotransferase class V-fold PLP-dependent enzyme [Bacteroidota bacterium]MBP8752908.1 aminotransferase class V-fold PLP-dependent enzyme [Chitinophagales bacterium]
MTHRRKFFKQLAITSSLLGFTQMEAFADNSLLQSALLNAENKSIESIAADEEFWMIIKNSYTVSTNLINLNNGGVSPSPRVVQEAVERYNKLSNEAPSYYMWRILDKGREGLRTKLAELAGCDAEEIAINRNTTEGLNNIINGIDLKAGDEVVLTRQDYPNMINAWKQREKRHGIVLKWVELELPTEDENYLVNKYAEQFTDKTKVVQINHIINWTGHINPVRKIADVAHAKGIDVMIDGAHTFGHFVFNIPDLGGDYFATSLHKWLCAPFGSGMLWIKKEKIKNIWPLMPGDDPQSDNIRKFENLGTRSFAIEQAIGQAIDFHLMIGSARKEARLRYLKDYWLTQVIDNPKLISNTSLDPRFSCAIANVRIDGMEAGTMDSYLFTNKNIHCVGINWENIHGIRIAPNVYTTTSELDILVDGLNEMMED